MLRLFQLLPIFIGSQAIELQWQPMKLIYQKIINDMRKNPSRESQFNGCARLVVNSADKNAQDSVAKLGAIEAIAEAMRLFPEDKALVKTCTEHLSGIILFNRDNGLRAGGLGCLNHTLHTYMENMDDPEIMGLGGAIGAYFDFVNENRAIAAELGGIQAIIQNIKNHFHGKYSDWTYNPVKQSLYALSSGCWMNQDICVSEGFPDLAVALMAEHGHEDKIAEETQQVTKALNYRSEEYRKDLIDKGIFKSMIHVLQVNPSDRGAICLTCENFAWLIGPHTASGPYSEDKMRDFNKDFQQKAFESGAANEILKVFTAGKELQHKEHGAFNFDVDLAYNVNKECFNALANLAHENPPAKSLMRDVGLEGIVHADFAKLPKDPQEYVAGGLLIKELKA